MLKLRAMAGVGIGVLGTAVVLIAPALGAPEGPRAAAIRPVAPIGAIGGFTPSSADPKLAAILARNGIDGSSFRFTPSGGERLGERAVTVAVRARSQTSSTTDRSAVGSTAGTNVPSLAPIAYNLGVSVGWKRFAVSGDLAKLDLAGQPGSRERLGTADHFGGKRVSSAITVDRDHAVADQPKLVADAPSASIGVGGSYSLTRNLDVTAGVRYKSEKDRLLRLEDTRRDSQAVYVGTAFRF